MIVCPITQLECKSMECSKTELGKLPMYDCKLTAGKKDMPRGQVAEELRELHPTRQMQKIVDYIESSVPMDKRMGTHAETAIYLMQVALSKR